MCVSLCVCKCLCVCVSVLSLLACHRSRLDFKYLGLIAATFGRQQSARALPAWGSTEWQGTWGGGGLTGKWPLATGNC